MNSSTITRYGVVDDAARNAKFFTLRSNLRVASRPFAAMITSLRMQMSLCYDYQVVPQECHDLQRLDELNLRRGSGSDDGVCPLNPLVHLCAYLSIPLACITAAYSSHIDELRAGAYGSLGGGLRGPSTSKSVTPIDLGSCLTLPNSFTSDAYIPPHPLLKQPRHPHLLAIYSYIYHSSSSNKMTYQGKWEPGFQYNHGDIVTYEGKPDQSIS
jgi:hypothetical protein